MLGRVIAAGIAAALLGVLTGCANLPFMSDDKNGDTPESAASAASAAAAAKPVEQYRLEVEAPGEVKKLLTEFLDLARYQTTPAGDAVDATELERLRRAAPAQARALLETEGYFNAEVQAERVGARPETAGTASAAADAARAPAPAPAPAATTTGDGVPANAPAAQAASSGPGSDSAANGKLPVIRVSVEPGERTKVESVRIDATGELKERADAGDDAAIGKLEKLRADWPLRIGDFFRQSAWSSAKSRSVADLRADGYANADWARTNARIDALRNRADLSLQLASGPLYLLGPLRIDGEQRYGETTLRRLAQFAPGTPYNEQALLDYQERIQKVGLYEGASVQLDPDPKTAKAAPVIVSVKEAPLQQATLGIGYSANTGPRASVEYTHRQIFGWNWVAKNKLELGPKNQTYEGDLLSYPRADLYRNLVSGSFNRLIDDEQTVVGWSARIGRSKETPKLDRLYFLGYTHARVDGNLVDSDADSLSAHYHIVYRDLDSLLLPTTGFTATVQGAAGYASGFRTVVGEPREDATGPFARLYSRLTWYRPLGALWLGSTRLEAGQVFTNSVIGIPDTLLFRAGGEGSVRGYSYRSLAPTVRGETVGGRTLLTASVEVARPFLERYPQYLGAVFIDAGDAADRWGDISPALGYGVGARWRSPLGPFSLDLAYGQREKQFRVHLSVGITF